MRSQANAYGAPDGDDNSRGAQLAAKFNQRYQFYLDKSVPHLQQRWAAWGGVALISLDPDLVPEGMVHRGRTAWAFTT